MDTTQETTQIAAELNKLPKPSSYNSLYILAQQAFENGFRSMTINELVVYLSKNLPDDLTRSEFIYEKFAPGSTLPDPGREASVFLGAGTYSVPGGGASLVLEENFNVVSWDGEKWVKVLEVPIEVPEPDFITPMLLNEQYGIDSTVRNIDGVISSAVVTWKDGTPGALTMEGYNSDLMSYDGYSITYNSSPVKTLHQPVVTRDVDGNIISLPNKIII